MDKEVFTLVEREKNAEDYQYKEVFTDLEKAKERMIELYHDVAVEGNTEFIEKAEIYDRSAIVYLYDGNIIEWDIE